MNLHCVRLRLLVLLAALTFCVLFTACGTQQPQVINYIEYPSFFTSKDTYKTVVVTPVENAVEPDKYIQLVSTNLMAKVQHNGAYKVLDTTKENLSESQLMSKASAKDPNALVLTSVITNYGETRGTDVDSLGINTSSSTVSANKGYSASSNGSQRYSTDVSARETRKSVSVPVLNFSRAMYAKLNVILKRVSDGEIVANEMVYAIAAESGVFGLNMSSEEERLKRALDDLTTNAVYYLAPSSESMKVEPDKILFTQKYGSDDWVNSSDFTPDDTIRVVFVISPRVAFNDFQIQLKAEGVANPLDVQDINYSGNAVVLDYKASDLAANSGGKSKYSVKLIYNNKVLSNRKFEIENK